MKTRIAVLTYNRSRLLEFTLSFLGKGEDFDVVVYDTHPDNTSRDVCSRMGVSCVSIPFRTAIEEPLLRGQLGCGFGRGHIAADFLKDDSCGDFLVMLDDDIMVNISTISSAVNDFIELSKIHKLSCIALHPFKKRLKAASISLGEKVFRPFDFTGESAMLWSRSSLHSVGKLFGAFPGYHGDVAFRFAGRSGLLVTRVTPPYEVQHLGLRDLAGSTIYTGEKLPAWVREPFRDYTSDRIFFSEYIEAWRSGGFDSLFKLKGTPVMDSFPKARGIVEIERIHVPSGKSSKDIVQNLVVNNAKKIMAHLLAGDEDIDDYVVEYMQFGTDGTSPSAADTQVISPISPVKDIEDVEYPTDDSVRFTVTLQQDEANGFSLAEAGLLAGNGLVARVVYGPLAKSSDFIFIFRWTIYWA